MTTLIKIEGIEGLSKHNDEPKTGTSVNYVDLCE